MKQRFAIFLFALILATLPLIAPSTAQNSSDCNQNCVRGLVQSGTIMSLEQILEQTGLNRDSMQLLDASVFERSGRWYYLFMVLDKAANSVNNIFVDAARGVVTQRPR